MIINLILVATIVALTAVVVKVGRREFREFQEQEEFLNTYHK